MNKKITIDDEVWTEEQLDERLNHSFQLGISEGFLRAKNIMLAKAHAYFEVKQDEIASRYRNIAFEFAKLAEKSRPEEKK